MTDDPDVKVQLGERRVYLLSMLMMLSEAELHVGIPLKIYLPGHFSAIWRDCKHTHTHTHTHTQALCRQTKYVQIEQAISGRAVCSSSENMQDISQTRQWLFFFSPSLSFFFLYQANELRPRISNVSTSGCSSFNMIYWDYSLLKQEL